MKIVVAMSGGVDSSVAAALLVEQGHEVIGLAMKTHETAPSDDAACDSKANPRACCTPDDMRDARRVAQQLDIPFYVLNYVDLFEELVVGPFAASYLRGETPNPCIVCNDRVKFRPLLQRAQLLGAEALATGHYARIEQDAQGVRRLRRGVDSNKDQSYFLYRLDAEQLQRLLFPLGGMSKAEVREHARRFGLQTAEKVESQEICFVGSAGYAATVERISGNKGRPGNFVDHRGEVVGRHAGIHHYTLGQRRGLGISAAEPLYVTRIDAASATVYVGPAPQLLCDEVEVDELRWVGEPPAAEETVLLQQRYREHAKPARITLRGQGQAVAHFLEPQQRGAPGQAAVVYRDDWVIGGGVLHQRASSAGSLRVLGG